eukprot:1328181-Amorphochlora_amoeboformis.AAC.2
MTHTAITLTLWPPTADRRTQTVIPVNFNQVGAGGVLMPISLRDVTRKSSHRRVRPFVRGWISDR